MPVGTRRRSPGFEDEAVPRTEIGAGVAGVRIGGRLQLRIELTQQHLDLRGAHRVSLAARASSTAAASATGRRVEINQYGTGSA